MATPQEIEERFWKALKSDMTMMLGLDGVEDGHARPMTAQIEEEGGPIWFFTSKDNGLVEKLGQGNRAIASFVSKGHDLFATVHGALRLDDDRATIDRLWNPFAAAWYEEGKDDPKLALLRLDPERAEIGSTDRASSPGSRRCSGSIPRRITGTRSRRSRSAGAELRRAARFALEIRCRSAVHRPHSAPAGYRQNQRPRRRKRAADPPPDPV